MDVATEIRVNKMKTLDSFVSSKRTRTDFSGAAGHLDLDELFSTKLLLLNRTLWLNEKWSIFELYTFWTVGCHLNTENLIKLFDPLNQESVGLYQMNCFCSVDALINMHNRTLELELLILIQILFANFCYTYLGLESVANEIEHAFW